MDQNENFRIPLIGEDFPELKVETTHGFKNLPKDYAGKWFMLFSHPGDFTPVCTTEFYSFARNYDKFKELNTELIGLSVDSVISHIEWVKWIKEHLNIDIPFPIIADPIGNVSKRLGMLQPQSPTSTVRAVFIVDPNSIVRLILYYPMEAGRNVNELLRVIKALQAADKYKAAIPANWPDNELIGSEVINPPPRTIDGANEALKKYKGYDWWLTYREP